MKRRFQVYVSKRFRVGGEPYVHGRLRAFRRHGWSTVGVFQLSEEEWEELAGYCLECGIDVGADVDEEVPA